MAFIKKRTKTMDIPLQFENLNTPDDVINFALKNGIETEPLDVSGLTELLGIKMNFLPMKGDDSGSLILDKKTGEWRMTVNSLHHPHRQRFTIAHEIGHHIKHGAFQQNFLDSSFFRNGETNVLEIEANNFAAELLMPTKRFHELISSGVTKVDEIAEYFKVSVMAVRVRAKLLGYQGHNL
ncbi:TPA: ImmA/IrrE family metallo-endopeptidase [Vibrio vulnificus]|nr:ImmA/IrrE family metallo-endopeptidase [Vibrio vulnificus]HAS6325333.1 ImmA/IrrE family metallo-endopeptidase [Vibrio vulnificus]HDY7537418.1 ImmA/IrrE family metallo-endopeptidase [Vibrio vulnificus]HDY7551599.1 ImmA/IrrE family metallo-endopeptidase [Vibrio vulnificus]